MKELFKLYICLSALLCVSCETTMVENPEDEEYRSRKCQTLLGQFQYIWNGINNSYVFWDIDPTDWDAIYTEYAPKFEKLDEKGQMGAQVSYYDIYKLMRDFSENLIDHHMFIKMTNPYDKYSPVSVDIGDKEVENRADFTSGYYYQKIDDNIRQYYQYSSFKKEVCKYKNMYHQILYATINGNIAYLKLNSCYLSELDSLSVGYREVFSLFKNEVMTKVKDRSLKGVILDYRDNPGGNLADLYVTLQLFSNVPVLAYDTRGKKGLGKYDFQPWIRHEILPNDSQYLMIGDIPIVTLINEHSGSGGEIIPGVLRLLPNVHSIGVTTRGAHGCLDTDNFNKFYTGSFNFQGNRTHNNNDAAVKTSTAAMRLFNKDTGTYECLEGKGISPDEYVKLDIERLQNINGDNQLDAALLYIEHGK